MAEVSIIGAGAFGTALALYSSGLGHGVRVWAYDAGLPEAVEAGRENSAYLPGFEIPPAISFTSNSP